MDEWVRWVVGGIAAMLVGLLSAVLTRLFRRQDRLYDSKANKESTDKRFEEMYGRLDRHMDDDRQAFVGLGKKIDITNERLAETNATLAMLVGRFEGQNGNGRRPQG